MIYTYHYSVLEHDGRLAPASEKIDAAGWLAYLQANTERYGNLHEFIAAAFPAVKEENPLIAAAIAGQLDESFRDSDPTVVCQYAMYCWEAFSAGEIPAGAWAAALAAAWQSGERAMLDHLPLSEALVLRMFAAADKEALFRVGASRKDWDAYFAALPEQLDIYRGITTAMKRQENGLSWTTAPEQAKQFSGRNVRSASEIPGVLHARVPKTALLAVFEPGAEVLIDPTVAKAGLTTNFLSGSGLAKFRQNWKKWQAEQAERLRKVQLAR